MRRHQVLTGAVNPGKHCFSVGSIASFTFWAYGSGCDLVILGVDLQPIHIIPGHVRGYQLITCLDCCQFCGKIAVSYGREIVIYHPKLIQNEKDGIPVFTWLEEATWILDKNSGPASVLSWASSGERLLVGCKDILLWQLKRGEAQTDHHRPNLNVQFSIEEIEEEENQNCEQEFSAGGTEFKAVEWELVWSSGINEDPYDVQFSPDDTLFASISRGDSMIKVWHERPKIPVNLFKDLARTSTKETQDFLVRDDVNGSPFRSKMDSSQPFLLSDTKLDFTFTYLIHPKPVVGFSWRKGVPLLPNGSMPNILISSCRDNMCRIWCETLTPETDIAKLAAMHATSNSKQMTGKKRHLHPHDKNTSVPVKKSVSAPTMGRNQDNVSGNVLPDKSVLRLFRHFHIAATINPTSDIPLLPSISSMESCLDSGTGEGDGQDSLVFTVHWLDNKHHHAMAHLNKILHETMLEMNTKDGHHTIDGGNEDTKSLRSQNSGSTSFSAKNGNETMPAPKRPTGFTSKFPVWDRTKPESVDAYLSCLASPVSPDIQSDLGLSLSGNVYHVLRTAWLDQSDALFAIHPTDGSLLVWHVSYLDENRCGEIRQAQVSFSSRIPMAIPARDASTLCSRLVLYANHYSAHLAFSNVESPMSPQKPGEPQTTEQMDKDFLATDGNSSPSINLLSKHSDGSLNQWEISFSTPTGYSAVSGVAHRSRFCGHRYHLSDIFCHPTLPLLLTTSRHRDPLHPNKNVGKGQGSRANSELILWRVDPVGALCHNGGITELARLNGQEVDDFAKVAWFPVLFPNWCLGAANTSPSSCFLSISKSYLRIYQAVVDAEELLNGLEGPTIASTSQDKIGSITSRQSSSQPGCVILLEKVPLGNELILSGSEILLLAVLPGSQLCDTSKNPSQSSENASTPKKGHHSIAETFYVILVLKSKTGLSGSKITVKSWKINFTASLHAAMGARSRRGTVVLDPSDSSEDSSNGESVAEGVTESPRLSCLNITSCKLTPQVIHHPPGEEITLSCAARDPFSLSIFQRIQPLPFTILTASKSGKVYFWQGNMSSCPGHNETITWTKEKKNQNSDFNDFDHQIEVGGTPLVLKMAHCSMLACLSATEGVCYVSLYECLSSGGSMWCLQDKIPVGNVSSDVTDQMHLDWLSREDGTFLLIVNVGRKVKIYAQLPMGMRWEDVSGSKVTDGVEKKEEPTPSIRPLLKRQSTLDAVTRQKILKPFKSMKSTDVKVEGQSEHLLHWSLLSEISIGNSIGLSAGSRGITNPVVVSWVRDGLLLVATETEMHIFCHWMEQQVDKTEPASICSNGVLYGSASLSQSAPEGLCQYLMQEQSVTGGPHIVDGPAAVSLMSVADSLSPCLPQYHPLVLSELTNGGHLETVKHILINLTTAINGRFEPTDGTIQVEPMKLGKFGLSLNEEDNDIGYKETLCPLLLYDLLDENGRINEKLSSQLSASSSSEKPRNLSPGSSSQIQDSRGKEKSEYDQLFTSSLEDDENDELELILDSEKKASSPEIIDLSQFKPGYLGQEHCQVLHNYLSRNLLPGLSSLDQMELMAIADTVANTALTKQTSDATTATGVGVDCGGRGYASSGNTATESMDQCGLRFVFAMHNHLCLLRSLPAAQRAKLLHGGLGSCHFAWAFHSDAEEEILSLISSVQRGSPEWDELRSFGAGWWIRSTATLRRLVEQTARAAFQRNNNPLDAAIFYMALNKKNVLKGLFKSVREERMMQFFAQDFKEDRWHRAALKNAFALMGKQRFQEAAAFFLLANSVQDAVEVCIEKMNDYQLASIIVRLYDSDKSAASYSEFLQKHVIGDCSKGGKVLPDPFIRSMAYWHLGSYDDALKTLLDKQGRQDAKDSQINITDVFNFYNFLRTHPLIMRQKKIDQSQAVTSADQQVDDSITMEERMLFFATAASHLEAGCPLLTLDVLSTLPPVRDDEEAADEIDAPNAGNVATALLNRFESLPSKTKDSAATTDWGESSFDIGIKEELELDWSESDQDSDESETIEDRPRVQLTVSTPIKKDTTEETSAPPKEAVKNASTLYSDTFAHQLRLMACLKIFVSELKCMATSYRSDGGQIRDELHKWLEKETEVIRRLSPDMHLTPYSTSLEDEKHGNDMDKNQKSDFSSDSESEIGQKPSFKLGESPVSSSFKRVPTLHELYLADKQDWKVRRERVYHRRRWLRQYRRFLRTLLSYCGLHDDARGSLSPLRMELLFLLQDSLQERSPQQLSSPVPNPTTIPLLSSSIVACRTVVAEPTARLSNMAQDILATVLSLSDPPPYSANAGFMSNVLCRQAEALASCVYQSLCDTNSKNYRARLLDKPDTPDGSQFSMYAATGQVPEQKYVPPSTLPSQWPGVVSLQALLNSESSDNRPRLIVLLCESLAAVYLSLLVHGLQSCNSSLLYRLVSNSLSEKLWNAVFGGGARVVVKYSRPIPAGSPSYGVDGSKVRDRFNRTVLAYSHERQGSFTSIQSTDSSSYREKFVAPETTLWDFFLSKPPIGFHSSEEVDFESDGDGDSDSDSGEEDTFSDEGNSFGELGNEKAGVKVTEHGDPNSYSWHILRLAIVRSALNNLKSFLPTVGLEICELGISSPVLNNVLQLMNHWQIALAKQLEVFAEPPPDFIKSIHTAGTTLRGRPAILKHQAMLDPNNTPFSVTSREALGARRLWHCLVRKENLQELFIRYIFHKKLVNENKDRVQSEREDTDHVDLNSHSNTSHRKKKETKNLKMRRATIAVMSPDPSSANNQVFSTDQRKRTGLLDGQVGRVKILHKETDIVSSFSVNNANPSCVVLATSREIQELDVSPLLACDSWSWIEEDMSSNLLQEELQKQSNYQKDDEFLVVSKKQSMFVTPTSSQTPMSVAAAAAAAANSASGSVQTGQGATMLLKRGFSGVRRMTSHPALPYYLSGHHDGSIRMWEWGHQQQISQFRATGQFPKVTNLHFSSLGNKIAAVDADGYLSLWQVSSPRKPYLYHQCHDRSAADCCFMSSTSVLATTGLSSTNKNVAIWDTLLPPKSMLVKDFAVHEGFGATCVAYAAQSCTLIVGGRDGKVSLFDLRRTDDPFHCFLAHEGPIKCIGLSPDDKLFVTGAVVGDVRVWDVASHLLVYNLGGEHARTSIFRNFGSGTMKVEIASPGNRVFSCGADGTLKLRILPHDEKEDFGIGYSMGSRIQKITLQKQVVKLANAVREQCLAY